MASEGSREIQLVAAVILSVIALGGITLYIAPMSHVAPMSPLRADDTGATPEGIRSVVDASSQFALELYSKIKSGEEGNIFYSPYSIFVALAMTYEGAKGQTADEIRSVFHFPDDATTLRSSLAAIYNRLNKADANYTLNTANALWVQEDYPLLNEYLDVIQRYYVGKATNVDFKWATEQARQTINGWVEEVTNNKIKDLIPSDYLDSWTRLVLTNAIYFNGTWVNQFAEFQTEEENFTVGAHQIVKVPMMSRTDGWLKFNYADLGDLQILEMLYKGGNLSMLVLLPKNNDLTSLENSLTVEKLAQWRNELSEQVVDVFIPKFSFTTKYYLEDNLEEMGMPSAFFSGTADFSGIDGTRNLFIETVIHQTLVSVNEKGTEAAGATAVIMPMGLAPSSPVFRADHPFMFMIQERVTGNILFLGRVINPIE